MARNLTRRVAFLLIFSTSLLHTITVTNANVTAPIVDLGYAQYQGSFDTETNVTQFLSVRYAAPPLGRLRFQAPQPPVPESDVQPATQNPNTCYQVPFGANTTGLIQPGGHDKRQSTTPPASEDCLFLNVFVPGTVPAKPVTTGGLPVLVWIHGGGYAFGYAAEFNGVDLLTDSSNTVVVVVIQYRLGVFGFLSGNEVHAHGALNAGLLDQNFALQWIQEHIGAFGGDKDHVTIWGESAGAGSVLQHIVANGGNTQPPVFHAAMVSSMYLHSQYHYNARLPQLLYNKTIAMTGCSSSTDTFTCLQSVGTETLQAANHNIAVSAFFGTFVFIPVVDGTFIRERPTVAITEGRVNGQVLLVVNNQNEGTVLVDANETLRITDYIYQLFPDMSSSQVKEAASIYQGYGTALQQAIEVLGDSTLICPGYYLLRAFTGRSWKGLFAIPPALHADDVRYYFNSPNAPPPYNNTQFIAAFAQSFMSLTKYYDVNTKFDPTNITPHWDKYNIGDTEMLFNRTEEGTPVIMPIKTDSKLAERCAFWSSVTSTTAQ